MTAETQQDGDRYRTQHSALKFTPRGRGNKSLSGTAKSGRSQSETDNLRHPGEPAARGSAGPPPTGEYRSRRGTRGSDQNSRTAKGSFTTDAKLKARSFRGSEDGRDDKQSISEPLNSVHHTSHLGQRWWDSATGPTGRDLRP